MVSVAQKVAGIFFWSCEVNQYPSISKDIKPGLFYYAFDKLDGSNIRAEWTRKNGFCKFGSRTVLLDKTGPLRDAEDIIRTKYEADLTRCFRQAQFERVCCFFEFFGKNSFAGLHVDNEEHDVVLIDVSPYKMGILPPAEFLKLVDGIQTPPVLFKGNITQELRDAVENSTLDGMTFEGVVCKAANPKKTLMPVMFKIKSQAWYEKLKHHCSGDNELFKKLA